MTWTGAPLSLGTSDEASDMRVVSDLLDTTGALLAPQVLHAVRPIKFARMTRRELCMYAME